MSEARVYVGNLAYATTDESLREHMASVGPVVSAEVMRMRSGRSKGCGLVSYGSVDSAQRSIAELTDSELDGRKIFVREDREPGQGSAGPSGTGTGDRGASPSPASSATRAAAGPRGGGGGGGGGRPSPAYSTNASSAGVASAPSSSGVFVGNLAYATTSEGLRRHMESAGRVVSAEVMMTAVGRSKGSGLVVFSSPAEAQRAISDLNDTILDERMIFVRADRGSRPSTAPARSVQGQARGPGPAQGQQGQGSLTRVFVSSLSFSADSSDVQSAFDSVLGSGAVVRADVLRSGDRSRGVAVVELASAPLAAAAIERMQGVEIVDRPVAVRYDRK